MTARFGWAILYWVLFVAPGILAALTWIHISGDVVGGLLFVLAGAYLAGLLTGYKDGSLLRAAKQR